MATLTALSSALGFAVQSAKGSGGWKDPDTDAADFKWTLADTIAGGPAPRQQALPQEIGGNLLPGDLVKLGISSAIGADFTPRPEVLGTILKGIMGQCVSAIAVDVADSICDGSASPTDAFATAGLLTVDSYTTEPGAASAFTLVPYLVITFTQAGDTAGSMVVTLTGTDENGDAITNETVTFVAATGAQTRTLRTTNRYATLSKIVWPAWDEDGDLFTVGEWSGYLHTFTFNSDPSVTDYHTVVRRAGGSAAGVWEMLYDCRFEALSLTLDALAWLTGSFSLNGIQPTQYNISTGIADLNAAVAPDTSAPFVSPQGGFNLDNTYKSAGVYSGTGDSEVRLASMAAQLGAIQNVDREFIIGSYYPQDIDIVARAATIAATMFLSDKLLYDKLMYAPSTAGVTANVTWVADVFDTSVFEATFRSGESIVGADDGAGAVVPYKLTVAAADTQWGVGGINLRGGDIVMIDLVGSIAKPAAGEALTLTLLNSIASYD